MQNQPVNDPCSFGSGSEGSSGDPALMAAGLALEKQSDAPSSALSPCGMGPPGTSSSSVLMTKGPRREKPLDESCNATGLTLMVPSYVWSTLPSLAPTMSTGLGTKDRR